MARKQPVPPTRFQKFKRLVTGREKTIAVASGLVLAFSVFGVFYINQSSAALPCNRRLLKQGGRSGCVRLLQQALNQDRFAVRTEIKADGSFGPRTKARLIQYQKSRRLSPTGTTNATTWNSICALMRTRSDQERRTGTTSYLEPERIRKGLGC